MWENYLIKGLIIGIVFGVPAGVVGVLSIQRVLSQGAWAGLVTGLGSSVADVFYACVGVFGITVISDFLLRHQRVICMAGCLMVIVLGIRSLRKSETVYRSSGSLTESNRVEQWKGGNMVSCFLSSFVIAITNPATILSFMLVFSMFQIGGTESMGENVQLVFGIFCGTCVWWLAIAAGVGLLRYRVTDKFYRKLNQIFGVLMVLLGIVIGARGSIS